MTLSGKFSFNTLQIGINIEDVFFSFFVLADTETLTIEILFALRLNNMQKLDRCVCELLAVVLMFLPFQRE